MADGEGTTEQVVEAPPAAAPPAGTPDPTEVTLLRSRAAGLDAKVTSQSQANTLLTSQLAAAAAKIAEYEAGKVNGDEALRAQLALKDQETAAARRDAKLARIEAKYPESFGALGAAVENLSDEDLASVEVRLKGVPATTEPPTPRGTNPPREGQTAPGAEETSADMVAIMKARGYSWENLK
jgi:hypothetical protein